MVTIPLRSDLTFFSLQVPLDGVTYTIRLRWNPRAAGWYLMLLDENATNVLMCGMRCVVGWPIGLYFSGSHPPGVLIFEDTSRQDLDPGVADLEARVKLRYIPLADFGIAGG